MATYRIAHFSDVHWPANTQSTFEADLSYLYGTLNPDMTIWGGDQMGAGISPAPHFQESDVHDFWQLVESYGDLDTMFSVSGNHDLPTPKYEEITNEYLNGRERTPQVIQPVEGLTVINIDTQAGSAVDGGRNGVGMDYAYISLRDFEHLVDALDAAHNRGDAILVFGHAPIIYGSDSNLQSHRPDFDPTVDPQAEAFAELSLNTPNSNNDDERAMYFICTNFFHLIRELDNHTPFIYAPGHDFHFPPNTSAELYDNINGIYQVWQDHYYADSNESTFAYFDVDTSTGNVTFKTVNSAGHPSKAAHTEQTIMDVTPTW